MSPAQDPQQGRDATCAACGRETEGEREGYLLRRAGAALDAPCYPVHERCIKHFTRARAGGWEIIPAASPRALLLRQKRHSREVSGEIGAIAMPTPSAIDRSRLSEQFAEAYGQYLEYHKEVLSSLHGGEGDLEAFVSRAEEMVWRLKYLKILHLELERCRRALPQRGGDGCEARP